MTTEEMLDRLTQIETTCTARMQEFDAVISATEDELCLAQPQLWIKHQKLMADKVTIYQAHQQDIEALKEAVKNDVLARAETVRGTALMAVYSKPKTTWDGTRLAGYAIAHPEVMGCANVAAQGSVSFRKM
jgi:hypothetical protein